MIFAGITALQREDHLILSASAVKIPPSRTPPTRSKKAQPSGRALRSTPHALRVLVMMMVTVMNDCRLRRNGCSRQYDQRNRRKQNPGHLHAFFLLGPASTTRRSVHAPERIRPSPSPQLTHQTYQPQQKFSSASGALPPAQFFCADRHPAPARTRLT